MLNSSRQLFAKNRHSIWSHSKKKDCAARPANEAGRCGEDQSGMRSKVRVRWFEFEKIAVFVSRGDAGGHQHLAVVREPLVADADLADIEAVDPAGRAFAWLFADDGAHRHLATVERGEGDVGFAGTGVTPAAEKDGRDAERDQQREAL